MWNEATNPNVERQRLHVDEVEWLKLANELPGKGPLTTAVMILSIAAQNERYHDIVIKPEMLAGYGLQRSTVYRALLALKKAGLIALKRQRGRSPTVDVVEASEVRAARNDPFFGWAQKQGALDATTAVPLPT